MSLEHILAEFNAPAVFSRFIQRCCEFLQSCKKIDPHKQIFPKMFLQFHDVI